MLSYNELCELVERNVIEGVDPKSINASSIDVHLGKTIIIENRELATISPKKRENFPQTVVEMDECYVMEPGEFLLAHTQEIFNLPDDISAEFRLKSSGARSGLNNLFACHCDAGWHGSSLTLELHNCLRFSRIRLDVGMPIGQMIFHRHAPVPDDKSYKTKGRYNKDKLVSSVKL